MFTELVGVKGVLGINVSQSLDRVKKLAFNRSMEIGIRTGLLERFADSVVQRLPQAVQVQLDPEFATRFIDLTREGMVPLGVAGHFSHLDHVVMSHLCHELISLAQNANLGDNMRGFVETLALSVPNGKQSVFMKGVYAKMESYAKKRGLEFVPITRKVDVSRYEMVKTVSETRPLVVKLRQEGIGVLMPAGGSVQPGRHPRGASGDNIYGLQEVTDTNIIDLYDLMVKSGKHTKQEPYFLPIAPDKTYRYFSSDSLLPTPEGLISLFGTPAGRIMITLTTGMPWTAEDMAKKLGSDWRNHPKEATDFLMTEVARNLPPNARGYYGKFVQEVR